LTIVTTEGDKTGSQKARTSKLQGWKAKRETPWGQATLIEMAQVQQQAGGKRFAVLVELLESGRGEPLIRLSYSTDGVARRGPVTLRARDLERLRAAVAGRPALAEALGLGGA
jgi:hypothetical protein